MGGTEAAIGSWLQDSQLQELGMNAHHLWLRRPDGILRGPSPFVEPGDLAAWARRWSAQQGRPLREGRRLQYLPLAGHCLRFAYEPWRESWQLYVRTPAGERRIALRAGLQEELPWQVLQGALERAEPVLVCGGPELGRILCLQQLLERLPPQPSWVIDDFVARLWMPGSQAHHLSGWLGDSRWVGQQLKAAQGAVAVTQLQGAAAWPWLQRASLAPALATLAARDARHAVERLLMASQAHPHSPRLAELRGMLLGLRPWVVQLGTGVDDGARVDGIFHLQRSAAAGGPWPGAQLQRMEN